MKLTWCPPNKPMSSVLKSSSSSTKRGWLGTHLQMKRAAPKTLWFLANTCSFWVLFQKDSFLLKSYFVFKRQTSFFSFFFTFWDLSPLFYSSFILYLNDNCFYFLFLFYFLTWVLFQKDSFLLNVYFILNKKTNVFFFWLDFWKMIFLVVGMSFIFTLT